jgi:hypothetical protein
LPYVEQHKKLQKLRWMGKPVQKLLTATGEVSVYLFDRKSKMSPSHDIF